MRPLLMACVDITLRRCGNSRLSVGPRGFSEHWRAACSADWVMQAHHEAAASNASIVSIELCYDRHCECET